MADSLMINVPDGFNLDDMSVKLRNIYVAKGFNVAITNMNNAVRIRFDKGCGGINTLLGLGRGITAICYHKDNNIIVNYTEAEWTGKIVGLCVGWIICFIPLITAIVGCVNQLSLPNEINNDITMVVNGF